MSAHTGTRRKKQLPQVAARKMLREKDADVESDSNSDRFSDPLSDSGDDDPELAISRHARLPPGRPSGPGRRDSQMWHESASSPPTPLCDRLDQPGAGPMSPAACSREKGQLVHKGEVPRTSNVMLPRRMTSAANRGGSKVRSAVVYDDMELFAALEAHVARDADQDLSALSPEDAKRRVAKFKQEAMEEGMRLVEQERKQNEEMHLLLRKRIEFLTEELENTRAELGVKEKECNELMEVATELDKELTSAQCSEQHDAEDGDLSQPHRSQSWLHMLQQNLLPGAKDTKGESQAAPSRVCAVPSFWSMFATHQKEGGAVTQTSRRSEAAASESKGTGGGGAQAQHGDKRLERAKRPTLC